MAEKVYVNVRYEDKDEAKTLGARWDPSRKSWWFPEDKINVEILSKWKPKQHKYRIAESSDSVVAKEENIPGADPIRARTDKTLRAWFDGGSRGNPGICGHGAILRDGNGTIIGVDIGGWVSGTNNEAEHHGCIAALRMIHRELTRRIIAKDTGPGHLMVELRGDSKLVIKQLLGEWECKAEHLREIVETERELLKKIREIARDGIVVEHIKRDGNADADALANLGMDQTG